MSTVVNPAGVEEALDECEAKLLEGAQPLGFTSEALTVLREAVRPDFVVAFSKGPEKWKKDKNDVLRMAWHIGVIAAQIASIGHEAPIQTPTAVEAFEKVREHCQLARGEYCMSGITPKRR